MIRVNFIDKLIVYYFLGLALISCNYDPKKFYEEDIKGMLIQGTVVNKYLDPDRHESPLIEFKDSHNEVQKYIPLDFYKLYDVVEKGDSISKPIGSLKYQIFRKDTVIELYPVIEGDTLK